MRRPGRTSFPGSACCASPRIRSGCVVASRRADKRAFEARPCQIGARSRSLRRRVRRHALGAILLLACLAGCGSNADQPLGAAEPAHAPELTATPAGTVRHVAPLPQGIVYDARTNLIAVAVHDPHRLLLLDGTTLAVERSVPLDGKVRHLQLAGPGGPVLVPVETADELVEVPLDGSAVSTTKVLHHPHDATPDGKGGVVVGDEFSHAYTLVRDGRAVRSVHDVGQPGGVRVAHGVLSIVDVHAFTVATYDLATDTQIARVHAGAGPTHGVPVGRNRLAVADTRGGHLLLFDLDPLKQVASVDLAGSPYGMASDPTSHTVWVTLVGRNKLVGFDVSGATPRRIAEYDTVRQADTVAVAPGAHTLWVAGTTDGVVQRITR